MPATPPIPRGMVTLNRGEYREMQKRINRTRKLIHGFMQAAEQMNDDLSMVEAMLRDALQPVTDEARPTPRKRTGRTTGLAIARDAIGNEALEELIDALVESGLVVRHVHV